MNGTKDGAGNRAENVAGNVAGNRAGNWDLHGTETMFMNLRLKKKHFHAHLQPRSLAPSLCPT